MGKLVCGEAQKGFALSNAEVFRLLCGQHHSHGHGGIRPRALCYHIRHGLPHLAVRAAFHKMHLWERTSVKNTHLTAVIPGHVFVPEQEGHVVVHSVHVYLLICTF